MPVTEHHWHYHLGSDGIAWLTLDKADSTVNVLSDAVLAALDDELKKLAATARRHADSSSSRERRPDSF